MKRANIIYINGRFLTQPNTGVQRYAHEIIRNFDIIIEEDHKWTKGIQIKCLVPPGTLQTVPWKNIACETVGINQGNLWEQFDLPLYLRGNILFSPCNTGPMLYTNQAITFHDASVFAVPHAYSFLFRLKYKIIFLTLSRLAQVIFTDSKFSQTELSFYLRLPANRFKVIYLAGDHFKQTQPDPEILERLGLVRHKYYLVVGSQSPHKNTSILRQAIELTKGDVKYVFVGGEFHKIFNKNVNHPHQQNIVKAGYTTDKELKALYLNAFGYIFPSYYEGFGLPVLEAMQCGCPVICSQAASLPEVAGNAALFFDPSDPQDIAQKLESLFYDNQLREELIQKGYQHANAFNWKSTAYDTLKKLAALTGV